MIVHIREQWNSIIQDYLGYIYFYCLVVLSLYNFSIFLFLWALNSLDFQDDLKTSKQNCYLYQLVKKFEEISTFFKTIWSYLYWMNYEYIMTSFPCRISAELGGCSAYAYFMAAYSGSTDFCSRSSAERWKKRDRNLSRKRDNQSLGCLYYFNCQKFKNCFQFQYLCSWFLIILFVIYINNSIHDFSIILFCSWFFNFCSNFCSWFSIILFMILQ